MSFMGRLDEEGSRTQKQYTVDTRKRDFVGLRCFLVFFGGVWLGSTAFTLLLSQ
jgi:hypothetical protein